MNARTVLLELLLSGFFAVACVRASVAAKSGETNFFAGLLRFPGRIERVRRSRWQWAAMAALMIVLRLQQQLPLALEWMALLQFLLFFAVPSRSSPRDAAGTGHVATL